MIPMILMQNVRRTCCLILQTSHLRSSTAGLVSTASPLSYLCMPAQCLFDTCRAAGVPEDDVQKDVEPSQYLSGDKRFEISVIATVRHTLTCRLPCKGDCVPTSVSSDSRFQYSILLPSRNHERFIEQLHPLAGKGPVSPNRGPDLVKRSNHTCNSRILHGRLRAFNARPACFAASLHWSVAAKKRNPLSLCNSLATSHLLHLL